MYQLHQNINVTVFQIEGVALEESVMLESTKQEEEEKPKEEEKPPVST